MATRSRHPPQATRQVERWDRGGAQPREDLLVVEEPLEIRIGEVPVTVTMRTPGHDHELAIGLLFSEGLLQGPRDVASVSYCPTGDNPDLQNVVQVTLAPGCEPDLAGLQRNFYAASSCGVCGKASIEAIARSALRIGEGFRVAPETLTRLPGLLSQAQAVFKTTGGLHAAGLFSARGDLLVLREDIGRHNAVDKVIGHSLLRGELPLSERVLVVSGRAGFEIAQKAWMAGIPLLAAVSAASTLAVDVAQEAGMTLVGFLRGESFVLYCGSERIGTGHAR